MIESAGVHTSDASRGHTQSFNYKRWSALVGGGALTFFGITRKSPLGYALAAGGGALAVLGATRSEAGRENTAHGSVLLNCFPEEAYRFWRDFENLPRFMRHLDTVTVMGDRRSRWVALGPMGTRISWDAEITDERENQYILWRSVEGSDVDVEGSVEFRQAPARRGTLIRSTMRFRSPHGAIGSTLAKLIGKDPSFLMRQDLRRLKALIETGEIPTTDGQSHGPRDLGTAVARIFDPDRPLRREGSFKEMLAAQRRVS